MIKLLRRKQSYLLQLLLHTKKFLLKNNMKSSKVLCTFFRQWCLCCKGGMLGSLTRLQKQIAKLSSVTWTPRFFYQDVVATTGVPVLPFAGSSHRPKNLKKNKYSYSHSHTHLLIHSLVLQERWHRINTYGLLTSWVRFHPSTPDRTPLH